MIKALIFDFFGVINVDPVDLAWRELGGEQLPTEDRHQVLDAWQALRQRLIDRNEVIDLVCKKLGISIETWEETEEKHSKTGLDHEVLRKILEFKKDYKTALLSNVSDLYHYIDKPLAEQHFDVIAASDVIGYSKPDARAYFYVLDTLGVEPGEAVFIDDIDRYCFAAEDLGIHTVWYQSPRQLEEELAKIL